MFKEGYPNRGPATRPYCILDGSLLPPSIIDYNLVKLHALQIDKFGRLYISMDWTQPNVCVCLTMCNCTCVTVCPCVNVFMCSLLLFSYLMVVFVSIGYTLVQPPCLVLKNLMIMYSLQKTCCTLITIRLITYTCTCIHNHSYIIVFSL